MYLATPPVCLKAREIVVQGWKKCKFAGNKIAIYFPLFSYVFLHLKLKNSL